MAIAQYPLDKAFLVAAWLESLVYGCFLVIFLFSIYVNVTYTKGQNRHNRIMFAISIVMFTLATMHLGFNIARLIRGFITDRNAPGGPVGYLGQLALWDHIFKDTIYATQSILGDAVAVYRCWILWNGDYRFVIFPSVLLIVSGISGYMVCGLYTTVSPTATVFDPRLTNWITTFYSVAVAQNIVTTGLMSLRLWQIEQKSARVRLGSGNFLPVLIILVESNALYLFIEILLLSLYAVNYNAQYILLEIVTPTVGITFSLITIRITMRSQQKVLNPSSSHGVSQDRQQVGVIPMRHIVISRSKNDSDEAVGPYTGPYTNNKELAFAEP
ncbi:hypothetical protein B0H11DRAFT_938401 [Mycena galericulata]|nr:hypothetical protein B0H11DRAFT_155022 [Mycena galericulata]KAJ7494480.1 hypothetical protein B0H11DRAFT_938401 [Mycena galericulata]